MGEEGRDPPGWAEQPGLPRQPGKQGEEGLHQPGGLPGPWLQVGGRRQPMPQPPRCMPTPPIASELFPFGVRMGNRWRNSGNSA